MSAEKTLVLSSEQKLKGRRKRIWKLVWFSLILSHSVMFCTVSSLILCISVKVQTIKSTSGCSHKITVWSFQAIQNARWNLDWEYFLSELVLQGGRASYPPTGLPWPETSLGLSGPLWPTWATISSIVCPASFKWGWLKCWLISFYIWIDFKFSLIKKLAPNHFLVLITKILRERTNQSLVVGVPLHLIAGTLLRHISLSSWVVKYIDNRHKYPMSNNRNHLVGRLITPVQISLTAVNDHYHDHDHGDYVYQYDNDEDDDCGHYWH